MKRRVRGKLRNYAAADGGQAEGLRLQAMLQKPGAENTYVGASNSIAAWVYWTEFMRDRDEFYFGDIVDDSPKFWNMVGTGRLTPSVEDWTAFLHFMRTCSSTYGSAKVGCTA